ADCPRCRRLLASVCEQVERASGSSPWLKALARAAGNPELLAEVGTAVAPVSAPAGILDNRAAGADVLTNLRRWCAPGQTLRIAANALEIGAVLSLGEEWHKADGLQLLFGADGRLTSTTAIDKERRRLCDLLDDSLEREKEKND